MLENVEDDFRLCNSMYESIISHSEKVSPPATNFSEEERAVILVWYVMGVIDNGGFHYLFESALPGDPYYHFTLEAYKQIGCDSAVEAFEQALENAKPSLEVKTRRIGGANYQIPIEVRGFRRETLAMRWIIAGAKTRPGRSMAERLANEFMDALNNTGITLQQVEAPLTRALLGTGRDHDHTGVLVITSLPRVDVDGREEG